MFFRILTGEMEILPCPKMPCRLQSLAIFVNEIGTIENAECLGERARFRKETTTKRTRIMKLQNFFKAFTKDESGAVTVDWVVLTAAIVGLGMVVMTTVGGSIEGLAGEIATDLDGRSAGYVSQ